MVPSSVPGSRFVQPLLESLHNQGPRRVRDRDEIVIRIRTGVGVWTRGGTEPGPRSSFGGVIHVSVGRTTVDGGREVSRGPEGFDSRTE